MNTFSDDLSLKLYGMTREMAISRRICINCKSPVAHATELSAKEYLISALCEDCFNEITKEDE